MPVALRAILELDASPELALTHLDLGTLLRDLEPALALAAREHRMEVATAGPTPVCGNADALRQVVWNLVENARRHSPPGSPIRIECRPAGDAVLLTVADRGEGIAPVDLPHVFERFYRGDPSRTRRTGGSGLGLAIVKSIALAHAGDVSLDSVPGQGTTVTVRLPRVGA